MKDIKTILRSCAALLLAGGLAAACDYDDATDIALVELGAVDKEYVVEADGGRVDIEVYANGAYHVEQIDPVNWISFNKTADSGDGKITALLSFNEEFKRMARIALCSDVDDRRDTLSIKQKGSIEAFMRKDNTSIVLNGAGGTLEDEIKTNVPFEYMTVEKVFGEEEDGSWLQDVSVTAKSDSVGTLSITSAANPDNETPRTATVSLSYTDGWGDRVGIQLNIIQRNAKESLGRVVTFDEFASNYATGKPVPEYVILEGIVVSNPANGNSGENEQLTTSTIDYTGSQRSVYLENSDGSRGVMLVTATADDNVFKQYDKVQVLLYGTVANLLEQPDRVNIQGVTKSMVVSQVAGTKADVPVKEKYIKDLTDNDVYTYVTLKDVEFPVRKGAITPVNEGYAIGTNAHRLSKYPLMVRDINANTIYMYTNTVCKYRNDGTRLPYGSGKISGVIVHERFSRFEWRDGADPLEMEDDVTLGNIGRYQIRHQTKDDIWGSMNDSVEDSFSALLTEYRYWNPDLENEVCRPTYGTNGWFTCTYQTKYTGSEAKNYTMATYKQHMWGAGTYEYLGPMGNNVNYMFGLNWGNQNGLGIVIDPAKEYYYTGTTAMANLISYNPDGTIEWCGPNAKSTDAVGNGTMGGGGINNQTSSMYGKSNAYGACYTAWANHFWWDYDTGRPYSWLFNFSTEGISTNHISMQISVLNTQQNWYSPRYWKAEWSFTESQAAKDDSQWHLIGNYTIPDVSVWANTLYSSLVGFKTIDFELPLEILGQPNVYIRLSPTSDICSNGADYANAHLIDQPAGEAAHASAIEYFAIRYNK